MEAIAGELYDLEAMRKEDSSWHPCRISLSSNDATVGIHVDFKSYSQEEIIYNKNDALTCLRFRSSPLQSDQCLKVKEGDYVLALHKAQSRSFFFDAVIVKSHKVGHSKRILCRCTFEVKWLNPGLRGTTMTVPSNSIMKLSDKHIGSHPVFAAFSNSLAPTSGVKVLSHFSCIEGTNYEAEIHGLLEKQIEQISEVADECNQNLEESILTVGRVRFSASRQETKVIPTHHSIDDQNFKTIRSRNKHPESEVVKHLEDMPRLSPLAARAALASFLQPLTQIPELLTCLSEKDVNSIEGPESLAKVQSLDETCIFMKCDASVQQNAPCGSDSMQNNIWDKSVMQVRFISSSSVSSEKGVGENSQANGPLQLSVNYEAVHTRDEKLNVPKITKRVTRSAVRKQTQDSTVEAKHEASSEKTSKPFQTTRLNCSGLVKSGNSSIYQLQGNFSQQDTLMEDLATPLNNGKEKRLSSLRIQPDTDLKLETKRRTRTSSGAAVTNENRGEIPDKGKSSQLAAKEEGSLRNNKLQLSARPRTRSQTNMLATS